MTDLSLIDTETEDSINDAQQAYAAAMESFQTTILTLRAAVAELRADVKAGEASVVKDLRAMNNALQTAINLESQTRGKSAEHAAGQGTGALDLDAARDEVRLRLACLRTAGDG